MKTTKQFWILLAGSALCIIASTLMPGCGKLGADGMPYAQSISSPAGANCYAIFNAQGQAIGGNCVSQ